MSTVSRGVGIEQGGVPDHLDGVALELVVGGRIGEPGWRPRVERRPTIGGRSLDGERTYPAPLGTDELLHVVLEREPVLSDEDLELQRLPAIGIDHRRPGLGHDQGLVDGSVRRIDVAFGLVGSIVDRGGEHRCRDAVAERCRQITSVSVNVRS